MASPRITAAVANLMLDAGIGVPANSGAIRVYTGTQPSVGGGAIVGQIKLMEFPLAVDAFPSAASGILTANPISTAVAIASGTATWFRMVKADGVTVLYDGSVGLDNSPDQPDAIIDSTTVVIGDVSGITSFTIRQPLA